ncbi:MAG: GNAT family N-acetyltransferase [Dehalococcoidia bacterium]|nr:GNAT family N-acetyltransferase [Dehalococcoidia bacterium]
MQPVITVEPATPGRWPDLVRIFGERGATDGCWCMWFRQTSEEYRNGRGAANRIAMQGLVEGGRSPGLIAYVDGSPAAWCAVAPREEYPRLRRSPITRPVDGEAAWAVVCFFTHPDYRNRGLGDALLRAAVEFAAEHGARLVEGYPVAPEAGKRLPPGSAFHGFESTFRRAGFDEVARRKPTRPVMRYRVPPGEADG